jgi:pimeloyl-ACP methyl ester carboxylesterase
MKFEDVLIGPQRLPGRIESPDAADAVIVFAPGSSNCHLSKRNEVVARVLHGYGFATLRFDLLTPDEAEDRRNIFDIDLLAERVNDAVTWVHGHHRYRHARMGLLGSGTGAAAALRTAVDRPELVWAVVSRGGRPDLVGDPLSQVTAPTLLIVGGLDAVVLGLNRGSLGRLGGECRLDVVPHAGHLFDEPGALDIVSGAAASWFERHLSTSACSASVLQSA